MQLLLPGVIFPPISYCILLQQYKCEIDGWGYYQKQSIRNHFHILSANGPLTLTIPIQSVKGIPTALNQIEIESGQWHKPMLRAIQSAYGKSPFYFFFKDELTELINSLPGTNLFDSQLKIVNWLCKYLDLPQVSATSKWEIDITTNVVDLRKTKKKWELNSPIQSYHQVFMDRFPFEKDLSILDLLFNLGPQAKTYLSNHPLIMLVPADHQNS